MVWGLNASLIYPDPSDHLEQVYSVRPGSKPNFSFSASRLRNKLPEYLRSAETVDSFKSGLKTLLFTAAYQ